jgi:hypothetical protein
MSGDQRRDRLKSEVASRTLPGYPAVAPPGPREERRERESEAPTRPRARTIGDSELPAEPRPSVSTPALRPPQDSFHPVRVPPRTVRPPLSLWTRAWGTAALVIVVAGGAIGIVTSLRARTLIGARAERDAARAAQSANEPSKRAAPAAAPGLVAPPPVAPAPAVNRSPAAPAIAETSPTASSQGAPPAHAPPAAVVYRTPESLAVSPPLTPSAAPALSRRTKPTDGAANSPAKPTVKKWLPDESAQEPTPAPATTDTPEKKGESEAWVTEERRF